ncbi:SDR family NAD(P)-dependent oxidoreductase [Nocardioides zhouii]|uniref:SDR family NAD(P)-dependent oxidoreductase n=1 Tax=Nocardioides zhouii TaxID=1168729 RepID=UPI0013EE3359|nr:SDR family oxidoreductase [Nocardioides zhouii]
MSSRLAGQVAIVTGGARQIGFAIASRFAAEGASVVLAQRSRDEGEAAEAAIRTAGGEATALTCDVADEDSVAGMVGRTLDLYGRLDVLVNNAGTGVAEHITDLSWDDYRRVIDINVGGVLLGTKYAARQMKVSGRGGSIINISSIQGVLPLRQSAVYAGSKGAVNLITQQTAADLGCFGIRVNAIAPGYIDNEMMHSYHTLVSETPGAAISAARGSIVLGRLGTTDDIAGPALFLASSDSAYVTGTLMLVDGGSQTHGAIA